MEDSYPSRLGSLLRCGETFLPERARDGEGGSVANGSLDRVQ